MKKKAIFAVPLKQELQEMTNVEEIITIVHTENYNIKIKRHEELHIKKAANSLDILNGVISGKNDPLFKLVRPQRMNMQNIGRKHILQEL